MIYRDADNSIWIDLRARTDHAVVYHFRQEQFRQAIDSVVADARRGALCKEDACDVLDAIRRECSQLSPLPKPSLIARLVAWFFKAQDAECCGK